MPEEEEEAAAAVCVQMLWLEQLLADNGSAKRPAGQGTPHSGRDGALLKAWPTKPLWMFGPPEQ